MANKAKETTGNSVDNPGVTGSDQDIQDNMRSETTGMAAGASASVGGNAKNRSSMGGGEGDGVTGVGNSGPSGGGVGHSAMGSSRSTTTGSDEGNTVSDSDDTDI